MDDIYKLFGARFKHDPYFSSLTPEGQRQAIDEAMLRAEEAGLMARDGITSDGRQIWRRTGKRKRWQQ